MFCTAVPVNEFDGRVEHVLQNSNLPVTGRVTGLNCLACIWGLTKTAKTALLQKQHFCFSLDQLPSTLLFISMKR